MFLRRDPIRAPLNTALNLLTLGKWNEVRQKYSYDKLFHLGLEVVVKLGEGREVRRYILEKNEVINVSPAKAMDDQTETLEVPMGSGATINSLLNGARGILGDKFFTYDAFTNNCQNFIIAILQGAGLLTPQFQAWVLQPVEQLIPELPGYTQKLAKLATTAGAIWNVALHGRGVEDEAVEWLNQLYRFRESDEDFPPFIRTLLTQTISVIKQLPTIEQKREALEAFKADVEDYIREPNEAMKSRLFAMLRPEMYFHRITPPISTGLRVPHARSARKAESVVRRETGHRDERASYAPKMIGRGGLVPSEAFERQLKAAGIDPAAYLRKAQQKAKRLGLAWRHLGFADDDKHKLAIPNADGRMVRFGAVGLGDHILYTMTKDPKAAQHRRAYRARATQIKGDWAKDEYSPNSLAIGILW